MNFEFSYRKSILLIAIVLAIVIAYSFGYDNGTDVAIEACQKVLGGMR